MVALVDMASQHGRAATGQRPQSQSLSHAEESAALLQEFAAVSSEDVADFKPALAADGTSRDTCCARTCNGLRVLRTFAGVTCV